LDILYHRYIKYEEGSRKASFWPSVRMAQLYNVTTDLLLRVSEGQYHESYRYLNQELRPI
jgi:hypothetical protein